MHRGTIGWRRGGAFGFWCAIASACVVAPFSDEKSGVADGVRCEVDADCKSGGCNMRYKLCAHSLCDCPGNMCPEGGEPSPDCSEGWNCVFYASIFAGVGEFFGVDRDWDGGYCHPTCAAGCPEHYTCRDGRFCSPDSSWPNPIPTVHWSGGAEGMASGRDRKTAVPLEVGQSVTLSATGESPIGASIKAFQWTLTSSRTQMMAEGATLLLTLEEMTSYARAELAVHDAEYRTGLLTVTFEGCFGAGTACGYQGSGCCDTCDKQTMLCL